MPRDHQTSQEVQEKIRAFEEADKVFKDEWDAFEREHEIVLTRLERLRDDRNAKLDEAKRALRAETESLEDMRTTFNAGPFKIQKKWSDYYIPQKFVAMMHDRGLLDMAVAAGVVAIKTEVAPFDQIQSFLREKGLIREFECCEDGAEAGAAISGPKSIPPFGAELKKE